MAAWRAKRDADRKARARFLRKTSEYSLKTRYGVTPHQVVELAAFQGDVCAICGAHPDVSQKRGGLQVDHDHGTGRVRGLLCEGCNIGLGRFKDDPELLAVAIQYLQSPPAENVVYTEPEPRPTFSPSQRNPVKQATLKLVCKHCGKTFNRKAGDEYASRAKGKEGPFCSRKCSGAWGQAQQKVRGLVHGTTNGYTYYKCRCRDCRKAHADAERNRLKRKRR